MLTDRNEIRIFVNALRRIGERPTEIGPQTITDAMREAALLIEAAYDVGPKTPKIVSLHPDQTDIYSAVQDVDD